MTSLVTAIWHALTFTSQLRTATFLLMILTSAFWPSDGGLHLQIAHAQGPPPAESSVQWRRTVNGWERADLWHVGSFAQSSLAIRSGPTAPLPTPGLHPIFVALLLLGTAGLLAIGERNRAPRANGPPAPVGSETHGPGLGPGAPH